MGICISYDRVLEVENIIAAAVSEQFEERVVAPSCPQKGIFIVGALDNLDHNPSSTTAVNAFHVFSSFPLRVILVKVGPRLHYQTWESYICLE